MTGDNMEKYIEETVISKPNYCVPATLEMVLKHHGVFSLTQDDIASQLQIIPNEEYVDPVMWGAQIRKDTINDFFFFFFIALHETYIPINHIIDEYMLAEKVISLLNENITIICGYNYSYLYGNHESTYRHVSIIVGISTDYSNVTLLDPGPKNAGYNTVRIDSLFDAIKAGKDGLWCIS